VRQCVVAAVRRRGELVDLVARDISAAPIDRIVWRTSRRNVRALEPSRERRAIAVETRRGRA
jgi:hypothetical protein